MDNINQRDSERRRHGLHRYWYNSGKLQREVNYIHGNRQGLTRTWYVNGKVWYECFLIDGNVEGEGILYVGNKNG